MSKIPEGATHTNNDSIAPYRKKEGGLWLAYADGDWVIVKDPDFHRYTPIQAEPEWTGEGLPPKGVTCEVKGCMSHYLQWNKVTVFAVRGKTVFFDVEDGRWGQTDSHEFRAVRTPEQIAAEKRDTAIKEMQRLVGSCNTFPFAELYDYGYRLQVVE